MPSFDQPAAPSRPTSMLAIAALVVSLATAAALAVLIAMQRPIAEQFNQFQRLELARSLADELSKKVDDLAKKVDDLDKLAADPDRKLLAPDAKVAVLEPRVLAIETKLLPNGEIGKQIQQIDLVRENLKAVEARLSHLIRSIRTQ